MITAPSNGAAPAPPVFVYDGNFTIFFHLSQGAFPIFLLFKASFVRPFFCFYLFLCAFFLAALFLSRFFARGVPGIAGIFFQFPFLVLLIVTLQQNPPCRAAPSVRA
ncbi:hypothetical protein H6B10_07130 [Gemmiger formicilis]|uniref:hypothetical protein n=1 Tax=Gemmiger formicilis TaxID=745368 RepID=UPI0019576338|nr:hypothetical protein [Gemmiger formicilis]MBM6899481.1 hypothetical protein [Gemmiger formicilis]